MTGKIGFLNPLDLSGFIDAENGSRVRFRLSSLVAYDIGRIAVGQFVTFDLKDGYLEPSEAVNVCVRTVADGKAPALPAVAKMRYVGFEHKGNVRSYRFERVTLGQPVQTIVVRVDLQLLALHHVAIQDGLDVCCQILSTQPRDLVSTEPRFIDIPLGEREMAAYRASRPMAAKPRRGPRKPVPLPAMPAV
jgi:hypothetical protein